jgi:dTDP-4-dehydrorhamnose reductase
LIVWPRILITGSAGQLGLELQRSFADYGQILAHDRDTVDLTVPADVRDLVRSTAPDIILNAAAYTAVDKAETDLDAARAANALAPRTLAEEAHRAGAVLVHYSTDYVFDGSKPEPWTEEDATNPLNAYGATKLEGEEAIRQVGGRHLIFRTSWVYGPRGKNFLLTMLRLGRERDSLKIVDDQVGAPTTSIELANATQAIVSGILADQFGSAAVWKGLYNMTCAGSVSWCGFARAIFDRGLALLDGKTPTVNPIPSCEFPTPAKRPMNSVLSNEKLFRRFGVRLAPWESALDDVMKIVAEQQQG